MRETGKKARCAPSAIKIDAGTIFTTAAKIKNRAQICSKASRERRCEAWRPAALWLEQIGRMLAEAHQRAQKSFL